MALPIEDYALIGDRRTSALVGRNGSIDWLCLPRFDSAACFAGLLGTDQHGHWQLRPVEEYTSTRRYLDGSAVLETTFATASGTVTVTDLMPRGDGRADVVRQVRGVTGTVRMHHEWVVRFDYGAVVPWVRRQKVRGEEVITAIAGPDLLVLRGPRLPRAADHRHVDELDVSTGDLLTFTTTWLPSHASVDEVAATDLSEQRLETLVDESVRDGSEWLQHCRGDVPQLELVRRSLLTLRLLTDEETGGIVAAPTTSLPEDPGGCRNWDYRYCWLRDAALTIGALIEGGYTEEAGLWRRWLLRAVAGDAASLQIMYAVDGARRLTEVELPHLPGYEHSTPVRIGNGAAVQRQLDVVGEVMVALESVRTATGRADRPSWALQRSLVEDLERGWRDDDHGLWEIRGPRRRFTHSQVMVWAAFDRAVRAVETFDLPGPVERWRGVRDAVRAEVLEKGYDAERGTFVQHYETREVDASLLVLPMVDFVAGDDPRMLGTIRAIEEDLIRDGLVLRYRTATGVDGLPGDEHPFLACSFWLVSAYARAGRVDDAQKLFGRLCELPNDVGLLPEEYDAGRGRMVGNFPQAFSHLALVRAAYDLANAGR